MAIVITEEDGLRLMRFDSAWCQGAMRIDAPDELELEYAARMSAWLLFQDLERLPRMHLVTLGLGAGSLTRFALRTLGMRTTAVEIDAEVIQACRTHFLLPADEERLQVIHGDARDFIAAQRASDIDVLQVDAYDASVDAPALDTEEFYADCRRSLRDDASVAVNLIGRGMDARESVARIRRGLRPRAVWQFPPTLAGNVVVVAHRGNVPPDDMLAARAAEIEKRWGLQARDWLAMARRTPGADA